MLIPCSPVALEKDQALKGIRGPMGLMDQMDGFSRLLAEF
jgi:hypothetical protein